MHQHERLSWVIEQLRESHRDSLAVFELLEHLIVEDGVERQLPTGCGNPFALVTQRSFLFLHSVAHCAVLR